MSEPYELVGGTYCHSTHQPPPLREEELFALYARQYRLELLDINHCHEAETTVWPTAAGELCVECCIVTCAKCSPPTTPPVSGRLLECRI